MVESFLEFIRGGEGRVIGEEAALSGGFEEFSFLGEGSDVVEGGEGLGVVSLGCEGERVGGDEFVLGGLEDSLEGGVVDGFEFLEVGEVGEGLGVVVGFEGFLDLDVDLLSEVEEGDLIGVGEGDLEGGGCGGEGLEFLEEGGSFPGVGVGL